MSKDWQQDFDGEICLRGQDYYLQDAVLDLQYDGEGLEGTVEGTRLYHVAIRFLGNGGREYACDCPYAATGALCKHMAAVLYAWNARSREGDPAFEEQVARRIASSPLADRPIEDLVQGAEPALLRKFLTDILERDESYAERFRRILLVKNQGPDLEKVERQVTRLIKSYYEGYGMEDEGGLLLLLHELTMFLEHDVQSFIDAGQVAEALEFLIFLMDEMLSLEADEGFFDYSVLAEECDNAFEDIYAAADAVAKEELFTLLTHQLDEASPELSDFIHSAWHNHFRAPAFLQLKLSISERKAENASGEPRYYAGERDQWAEYHLQLMAETGAKPEELAAWAKKYWAGTRVRDFMTAYRLEREELPEALEILEESLVLDKDSRQRQFQLHSWIKSIHKERGDLKGYRQELEILLTQIKPGDSDLIHELKTQLSAEEWKARREAIFADIRNEALLAQLYAEEDLPLRLLELLLKSHGLALLGRYEQDLLPEYAVRILEKYRSEIQAEASQASKRSSYQRIAGLLQHVQGLPGGQDLVRELVDGLRRTHNRRPAFMDELKHF